MSLVIHWFSLTVPCLFIITNEATTILTQGGAKNSNRLDVLANEFGARNLKELNNWIIAIRDVRNRCAHHSRVWNANHRQASGILNKLHAHYQPTNPNKIYLFCILLKRMDDHLSMGVQVKHHLLSLFDKYPESKTRAHSAGFPVEWYDDPIWS